MDNSKEGNGSSPPPPPPPIDLEPTSTYDTLLEYISEMLMDEEEEELGNNIPFTLREVLALQATEKSLHDALHNINLDTTCPKSLPHSLPSTSEHQSANNNTNDESKPLEMYDNVQICPRSDLNEQSKGNERDAVLQFISEMLMEEEEEGEEDLGNNPTEKSLPDTLHSINQNSGVKKNHRSREDMSEHHRRSHKQLANNNAYDDDESEPLEMYDDVLLCPNSDGKVNTCGANKMSHLNKQSKRGPKPKSGGGKKNDDDIIDMSSLLMHCAEAVAKFDNKTVNELLREIRRHSSPKGDDMERLAHYFAYALEARLTCTGTHLYAAIDSKRVTMADILKAYRMFFIACPFRKMTKILTNRTIDTLDSKATTLHIIDFGILYGFQWPDLIYALSERPGGPPKLRITGIDFPQPGFRPAERVAATGRRLAKWADRFRVPFEFNGIAQNWDNITLEDLRIEKYHELVVVNCMYRLQNMSDETETGDSPRDNLLNLIKNINPEMFIHGIANGSYNTPFFFTRFKEAFFHFSSMFDMFDATMPRDDEYRMLFEQQIFGKEAMNIIACEGTDRVERPEKYRQWQARTVRAGFTQVPIDQEIVKYLCTMKTGYHKNFSVDEDGKWVLLGWKGRVLKAFSCWRPTHNRSSS